MRTKEPIHPELRPDGSGAGSTSLALIEGDFPYNMVLYSFTYSSVSLINYAFEEVGF